MNVLITLKHLKVDYGNTRNTLHLVFPEETTPYCSTNILEINTPIFFKVQKNMTVLAVLHIYNGTKLEKRILFQPVFNDTLYERKSITVEYNIAMVSVDNIPFQLKEKNIHASIVNLDNYVNSQLNLIKTLQPKTETLKYKHAISYELCLLDNKIIHVPYVTISVRGFNNLQNITYKQISEIQSFFRKDLNNYFLLMGKNPTDFTTQSKRAFNENDDVSKHAIMIQIANYFSYFIEKKIKYVSDYNATGKKDYVGFNLDTYNQLEADCEDIASAAYDILRIFRKIFNAELNDVLNPATTLPYHVSAWLNNSDIALFQGEVFHNQSHINHIWCAIMLKDNCPFVYVEGTREATDYHKYKHVIRSWMMKGSEMYDYLMIHPSSNVYGLPSNVLTNEKNANSIFKDWAKNLIQDEIKEDIRLIGNINTETFSFLNKVILK